MREIASEFGVSFSTIQKRCADEKWVSQKKKYNKCVEEKVIEKAAEQEANRLIKLMEASEKMDNMLNEMFDEHSEALTSSAASVKSLSSALKDSIDIKKSLYGLMSEYEKQKVEIDRMRIQLMREQFEYQKQAENVDKTIKVEFVGEASKLEDWSG